MQYLVSCVLHGLLAYVFLHSLSPQNTIKFHIVSRLLIFFFGNIISEMFEAFSSNALNRVHSISYLWQVEKNNENWNVLPPLQRILPLVEWYINSVKNYSTWYCEKIHWDILKRGKQMKVSFAPGKDLVAWKIP